MSANECSLTGNYFGGASAIQEDTIYLSSYTSYGKLLRKKAWNQFQIKSYAEHDNIQRDNVGSTEIKEKEAFLTEDFSSKGKPYNPDGEVTKRE